MVGLYAAVTRKGMSGRVFGDDERVTMAEAIRAYTRDAAYITFDEKRKGTLEPGRLADMIVLGEDLLRIDPERIRANLDRIREAYKSAGVAEGLWEAA